jgi:hypothetical protein
MPAHAWHNRFESQCKNSRVISDLTWTAVLHMAGMQCTAMSTMMLEKRYHNCSLFDNNKYMDNALGLVSERKP